MRTRSVPPLLLLALAALAALAAADHNGWKTGSEYRYEVQGRTLATLDRVQADRYSGIVVKALLTIQPRSEKLHAKISKARYAQIHTELSKGWDSVIPKRELSARELPISERPFEMTLKNGVVEDLTVDKDLATWEVNVLKGIVGQLQVDTKGENAIESKQPYAVYKTMEDSVSGKCEVLYDVSPLPDYVLQSKPELAPQPQLRGNGQIIDIVKTKNFSRCEQRMGYHFGFNGKNDWEPGTNDNGKFLSRSSVSRIIVSGSLDRYTIQSSVTTNKVTMSPLFYNGQNGMVVSCVNLTLAGIYSVTDAIPSPSNPETTGNLVYNYNEAFERDARRSPSHARGTSSPRNSGSSSEESEKNAVKRGGARNYAEKSGDKSGGSSLSSEEETYYQPKPGLNEASSNPFVPFFVGFDGSSCRRADEIDASKAAKDLATRIGTELRKPNDMPEEQTLEKFTILICLLRTMNAKQLSEVTHALCHSSEGDEHGKQGSRSRACAAYRDAVASTGSGPALVTIKDWIESKKVEGIEAAELVAAIGKSTRDPTPEYMGTLFSLVTNAEVLKQEYLNTTALLAFADLVRDARVDNRSAHNRFPVHSFGRFFPKRNRAVTHEYVPFLAGKLRSAVQNGDGIKIQIYARALGNTAHPSILTILGPYLVQGKNTSVVTTFQRQHMVTCVDRLAKLHPELARPVLYGIYRNTAEHCKVRCAAVPLLMLTNPPTSMLQAMAEFTNQDHSKHVSATVKSAIESAAELGGNDQRELARAARAARNLLNPETYGSQYSHSYQRDNEISKASSVAYRLAAHYIGSDDSIVPQAIVATFEPEYGCYKADATKIGAATSSIRDLVAVIASQFQSSKPKDGAGSGSSEWSPENIANKLKITLDDPKQLEGILRLNARFGSRAFAFDNRTIERIPKALKKLARSIKDGRSFDLTKLINSDVVLSFPTAMGLPFFCTMKTPSLLRLAGTLRATSQPDLASGSSYKIEPPNCVNVSLDLNVVYATQVQGRMGFVAPFEHYHYVAGVDGNLMINLPIRAHVDLDFTASHVRTKLESGERNEDSHLIHYSVKPFTGKHDIANLKPLAHDDENTRTPKTQRVTRYQVSTDEKYGYGLAFRLTAESEKNPLRDLYSVARKLIESKDPVAAVAFPWADQSIEYCNWNVFFDKSSSSYKHLALTASYGESVVKSKGDDRSDDDDDDDDDSRYGAKAGREQPADRKADSHARRQRYVERAGAGMNGANVKVIDLGVEFDGNKKATYVATAAYASSYATGKSRAMLYLYANSHESESSEMCIAAEATSTKMPKLDFEKALTTSPKGHFNVDIGFGETCDSGGSIEIKGQMQRNEARKEYLSKRTVADECRKQMRQGDKALPACASVTYGAGLTNEASMSIKYDGVSAAAKNASAKVLQFVRAMAYYDAYENTIDPKMTDGNVLKLSVSACPRFEHVNLTVSAPGLDVNLNDVQLPPWATTIVAYQPATSTAERSLAAACVIDRNRASTFDSNTYPVRLDDHWHVAMMVVPRLNPDRYNETMDIPEDMQAMIMLRRTANDKKEIMMTLSDDDVRFLPRSAPSRSNVTVNGQKIVLSRYEPYMMIKNGVVVFTIDETMDGKISLMSGKHGISVVYDEIILQITASYKYSDTVRGLCGTFDREPATDFTAPSNCVLKKAEDFVASYALSDDRSSNRRGWESAYCPRRSTNPGSVSDRQRTRKGDWDDGDKRDDRKKDSGHNRTDRNRNDDDDDDDDDGGESGRSDDGSKQCLTYRTKVIEEGQQTCFSLRPVPSCSYECSADEKKEKNIQMHCTPNGHAARQIAQRIYMGANPDFSQKSVTKSVRLTVPTSCSSVD